MKAFAPLTSGFELVVESSSDVHALAEFTHDLNYEDLNPRIRQQARPELQLQTDVEPLSRLLRSGHVSQESAE